VSSLACGGDFVAFCCFVYLLLAGEFLGFAAATFRVDMLGLGLGLASIIVDKY
jgi:hypothetical protein